MLKRLYVVINPAAGQPEPVLHTINSVCRSTGVDWEGSIDKDSYEAHLSYLVSVQPGE